MLAASRPPRQAITRAHCYSCDKPASLCLCDRIPRLPQRTGIHVLQHPRERRHPLGTARLLKVGLTDAAIHVLQLQGRSAVSAPVSLPEGAGLLYPSEGAVELGDLSPAERPPHLVVVDGTWTQAHRIYRDNPWIQALPHYRLSPVEGSRYRIRTEPRHECLSTLEAVIAALRLLEPELAGTDALLSGLDTMIDAQIAAQGRARGEARRIKRNRRPPQPIPASLRRDPSSVVVVYGEAAPVRAGEGRPEQPIRLSATTLDGSRTFDAVVASPVLPDGYHLQQMGLDRATVAAGRPWSEVAAEFLAYCGDATVASWGPWTHRILEGLIPPVSPVLLKGVWANATRQTEVIDPPQPLPVPGIQGRSGLRLARAQARAQRLLASVP